MTPGIPHRARLLATSVALLLSLASPAHAQLSGTHTIGAGGTYATFAAATAALVAQGVSGPVTFDVIPGAYTEHVVIPAIAGASATNRITFRSQTGNPADVVLWFTAVTGLEGVVELAGANGVTISAMTIGLDSLSTGGYVVLFAGGGSDNQLIGCVLPSTGASSFGVYVTGDQTRLEVRGNTIDGDGSGGLYLESGYFDGVKILANRFENSTLYALYWTGPASGSLLVANNFLANSSMEFSPGPGSGGVEIAHNSVTTAFFGLAIFASGAGATPNSFTIVNNVLTAVSGGIYAYMVDDASVVAVSDHNDIFGASGSLLAGWNGSILHTLAQLQAASGKDLNSVSVAPAFVSGTDLHTSNPSLNGFATPLASVTTDIDGEPRDVATPDIGADEFTGSATSLAGTYTIGAGQDYENLGAASAALSANGVSGPVTFDIVSGTYIERLLIGTTPGASPANRVTFRSQTGNAADVAIEWTTTAPGVAVAHIGDGSYVTLADLTIRQFGTSGGSAMRMAGSTVGNRVINCVLEGGGAGGIGVDIAAGATADSLEVRGNTVSQFATGLHVDAATMTGARVLGNTFSGILGSGMDLRNWTGPASGAVLVANNFLVGARLSVFQSDNSSGLEIVHNTIRVSGSDTALDLDESDGPLGSVRVRNNILACAGDGLAMRVATPAVVAASDHNDFFGMGNGLVDWGGTVHGTLASLKAASGQDANSVSFDPGFASATDLHTQLAGLADLGSPITSVTTDIDGEPRSATTPDIGADEYTTTLTPMAGAGYTIGSGGTYPTFDAALGDLARRGVSGPVTFDVAPGTYVGQVALGAIAGAAAANRVTFRSSTGSAADVTLQHLTVADRGVLELVRADHVTFSTLTLQVTSGFGEGAGVLVAGGSRGAKVLGCVITGLQGAGDGLSLQPAAVVDSLEFRGNSILQSSRAVYAGNPIVTGVRITGNRIENSEQGISLEYPTGPATGSVSLANNFIVDSPITLRQVATSEGIEIHHNSVNMATSLQSALVMFGSGSLPANSVSLLNNIFSCPGGNMAVNVSNPAVVGLSDHNDFYTTGATLARWGSNSYATLGALQAASGKDANSLNTIPGFASTTDLHTTLAALDNRGTPVASVTEDFDGDPRNATAPDIGADEFTALPALAGTYTIGAGGSYATLAAALADLDSLGVVGPVTFDILSGTYTGQVVIRAIPGASPTNRVTFRSQTGNAANVTLQFATLGLGQSVVELAGASHVTLSALTLQVTHAAGNGVGARITGTSDGARILNCVFTGLLANGRGIEVTSATCSNLEIRENTIPQSIIGITLSGAFTSVRVGRNSIGTAAQFGIYLTSWTGPANFAVRLENNVLQNARLGVVLASLSQGAEILHNTVSFTGTTPALAISGTGPASSMRVVNNVVSCTGGAAAYSVSAAAPMGQSDHNAFHTTGLVLASWNAVSHASLASLRAASGKDLASLELYPGFIDATLHTRLWMLDGAGTPVPEVTTDFDGEPRSATAPDIGADEFSTPFMPLAGTYTVGSGGDYGTLAAAAIDLLSRGVSGPVTFNLLSQTFPEQLSLYTPAGASPANRVTFRSQSGNAADATVAYNSGPSASGVLLLGGTDYVTFSDLTIRITHATGLGYGVQFLGGSIGVQVLRCVITGMQTTGYGIYWPSGTRADSVEIHGNTIVQSNRSIYVGPATLTGVRIVGNSIRDASAYGILIDPWTGPATGALIVANNMLTNSPMRLTQGTASLGGDILHNTVHMTSAGDALALVTSATGPSNSLRVRNNILACPGGGMAFTVVTPAVIAQSDNNCLYTTGAALTLFGSTSSATLADHQAANGKDLNSVSFHPGVVSATDLHTTLAALDGRGAPLASVTTDFDGAPRDASTPDIGADEFTAVPALAGDYTIGSGGTYATFAAANADLLRKGVSAPVSFRVLNGIYTGRLLLETPGGASPSNRVDFRSNSGNRADVTLQFATSGLTQGVVEWLSADWISLSDMTVRVTQATGLGTGVRLTGITTGARVSGCNFRGLKASGYGLNVTSGTADSLEIAGCAVDSGGRGISFESPIVLRGARVLRNNVASPVSSSVYLSGWAGPATGSVLFANNSFASLVQIRTTSTASVGAELFHNSVSSTAANGDALSITVASGTMPTNALRLKNNAFAAFTGGRALNLATPAFLAESDYNDLFTSGSTLVLGGSTNYGTLAEWQATGRDPNSISVHPGYVNVSSDLHSSNAYLDGRGTPIAVVPDDIDGQPRSATAPDIGADESAPLTPLAGTFTVGTGGDYATPTAAIADLYRRGVSAPVSLDLLPGTYSGQWFLQTPAGASPSNRVTVRSQSGNPNDVTLQATLAGSSQGVVELRGADYVTLSALTLNETSGLGSGVLMTGRSTASQVLGCRVTGLGGPGGIGIYLLPSVTIAESLEVRGNTILTGAACFYVNGGTGLTGVRVLRNIFNATGTSAGPIAVSGWTGPATGAVLVANNFITGGGRVVFNQEPASEGAEFYYNSVSMNSNQAALYTGLYTGTPPAGSLRIKNNVLANSGSGPVLQVVNTAAIAESDYNDFYKPSAGTLANWGGVNHATFANYLAASGKDTHSVNGNPFFTSATDLHTSAALLADAGTPIAAVTDDFDGQPRSLTTPDIGADEFAPLQAPLAGAYAIGTGGDYATFSAAVTDLVGRGVSGPVTIDVLPGTYTEQLTINPIVGASPANRVTFRSQTGNAADVTLQFANSAISSGVLQLQGTDHVTFSKLTIRMSGAPSTQGAAVYFTGALTGVQILGCTIAGSSSSGRGLLAPGATLDSLELRGNTVPITSEVMSLTNCTLTGVRIVGNRFLGVTNTTSGGLIVSSWTGPATGALLIANNFCMGNARLTLTQGATSQGLEVYSNSVGATGTNDALNLTSAGTPPANSVRIKNNIFYCASTGRPMVVAPAVTAIAESDHNDLYRPGAGVLAVWGPTNYTTLAALQAASGKDLNSVNGDPLFTSGSDFHTTAAVLAGAGTPVASVPDDIDGEPRSATTPDIGADEFGSNDVSGPVVTLTSGQTPGGSLSNPTVTFAWNAVDNVSIPAAVVSTWTMDTVTVTLPAGVTTVSFDSLAAGAHTFSVSARDEQDNTGAAVTIPFTYVIPAPSATSPTAGPIVWSWPAVPAAAKSWQVEVATAANPDSIVYTTRVDHPGFAWSWWYNGVWNSPENSGVQYVARVSPSVEYSPASYGAPSGFSTGTLLDRDPPTLGIVSGPAEGQSHAGSSANFVVSGTDAGVGGVQYSWRLDRGPWSAWQVSGSFTVNGLTAGAHTVQVSAKDSLGNTRTLDCPIEAQGLASLWAADDGAPGLDRVGSNDGTAVGGLATTTVGGHAGNALVFNGTDALLEIPDSPSLYPGTGSFSLGAWVKYNIADVTFGQRILARRESGGVAGGTAQSHYEIVVNNGVPRFEVGTPNGFTGTASAPQQINDGQWHHLVGVWNLERRYIAFYVDGAIGGLQYLDGEDPFGTQVLGPIQDEDGSPDPLVFGGNQAVGSTAGENLFKGQLDDAMYVAHALDGRQVERLYLTGGHAGCAPIRRNFGVDQIAPIVAFEAGPSDGATLLGDSTSYAWSATDNETPPASMTYRSVLDGAFSGAYTAATSRALTGLADGVRTFRVEAKDLAGNVSAPAARTLRVHKTAPDVAFDSPSGGAFTGAAVTVAWHLTTHSTVFNPDSIHYEHRLDGVAFTAPGRDSSVALTGLAEGPHTVDVRVTDNAGLTNTRSLAFTADLTPPTVAFTAGPPEGGFSTAFVNFTFVGSDNLTPVNQLRYSRSLDGGAFTAPTTATGANLDTLGPGPHVLVIHALDAANNVSADVTRQWTVDDTPPETQIAGGPADGSVQTTNSVTFDFTGSDNLTPIGSLRFQSRVDGQSFDPASTATGRAFTGLADGAHTFDVRAMDLAGLVDATPATRAFTVDAQGPAITIASGPANNACIAVTDAAFAWSATDAVTPQPQLEFSYQLDAAPFTAFGATANASFTSLAEGLHTFTLQARDGSGHVSTVARTFRVDVSAPLAAAPTTRVLDSSRIRVQCTAADNSGTTGFRVQVSIDPAFGSVTADVQIGATGTYDFAGIPGNSYYARSQAGDCAGNLSAFTGPSNVAILASLPNLLVTNVTAPPAMTAGQATVVDYTVSNNGAGPTSTPSWTEHVYLSPTPTYNASTALLLGQRQNVTFLGVGESYTGSVTVTIPIGTSGTRYMLVTADATNLVPEMDGTDNTTASGPIGVTLGAIADLVVTQVVAPPTALSSEAITVSWTVRNDGAGRTDAAQWFDAVFLSADPVFDFDVLGGGNIRATDDWLGRAQHTGALEADSSYTASMQVVLPPYFGGTRYLIVASDMNASADNQSVGERGEVFEDQHESNAAAAESTEVTQQLPPDLTVDAVTTSGAPVSGGGLQVTLTIGNHGFNATGAGAWSDRLHLSTDAVLDAGDLLLGTYPHSGNVDLDGSYSRLVNVTLPRGVSGPRYLIATADAYAQLTEYLENNNSAPIAQPIVIALAAWANLVPFGASVSDTVFAGGSGTAQWLVANSGVAAAIGSWTDVIDVGAGPAWTSAARVSGSKRASHALQPGESYAASTTFDVPTSYSGTYHVFARTDGQNEVFEHTDEGDNVVLLGTVYVKPYPAIDLAVSNISAPANATGGQSLPVTYTVTNVGAGATLSGNWAEDVWLSADAAFSPASDLQITAPGHAGALAAGASYTRTVNGTPPTGLNGTYFVLVRSDPGGGSGDGSLANNSAASVGTVVVTSPAPPQLTASNVTVAANLDAGQPALIGWQLNNVGAGPVPNAQWYVGVYLSQDPWLDGSDISLGSLAGPAGFAGGTNMPQQLTPTMPVWASGAYYVLVRTDNRNEVWEAGAETDNTAISAPTVLTLPPPSDLVVTDVVVPAAGVPGEPILVSYTLANQGLNPAVGQLQNAVYMSADAAFISDDDPLVGIEVVNINLPPGGAQRFSHRVSARPLQVDLDGQVTGLLPALSPGAYHAIVHANIRANIRELDGGNNEAVSLAQVQTDLPALILEVPAPFTLANAQAKFYKVTVPAEFDLRLQLSSSVVDATNEMFVAFGRTPDENEYDFASPAEFTANPVVLVPQTQAGTYYIMVMARSMGQVASSENLTLLAQTLPFQITSHTPGAGGAGGRVTVRVRGAGLRDTTEIRLEQSGIVKARAVLAKFTNSTDVLTRFDLAGVPEGLYDLVAVNGQAVVVVPGGFAVEAARPIEVAIETDNADVLRRSAIAPFTVRLRNPSNQDAPVVRARVLFPATSELRTAETSPGLFRMSQLVPSLEPVKGDVAVLHRADGTDSLKAVDVIAGNLAPGEVRSLTLGVSGFASSPYSLRVLAEALTLPEFMERQIAADEAARRALLVDPSNLSPALVQLANDAFAFRDSALQRTYARPGVLDATEVELYLHSIDHYVLPSTNYPMPAGPQALLDELAAGGPCAAAGEVPECAPEVAVPGSALPACVSVFGTNDLAVPLALDGGVVARVAGSTVAGYVATASANTRIVVPCDPNLMTGPAGFGTEKWVRASLTMPYRVDFENLPGVASAPAQVVRITVPIDANLDPTTFRVGGMGFGGTNQIGVPAGRTSYSTQPTYADLGLAVRITAGINLTTREASWVFTTIDPATGQQPTNPYIGFLPVNDQVGSGTGFVTYSIQPYANAALGAPVQAQASIKFDSNTPVPTNLAANRVDPRAPASAALTSIEVLDLTRVRVHWTTNNDSTGAGLSGVTLYARQDVGAFAPVTAPVTGSSLEVPVAQGHTFGFYTLAVDNVGNAEALKSNPEAAVTLGTPQLGVEGQLPRVTALHQNYPNPFRGGTHVRFDLARAETVTLDIFDVQGRLVGKPLDGKKLAAGAHTIEVTRLPRGASVYFYRLRAGSYEKTRRMVLIP